MKTNLSYFLILLFAMSACQEDSSVYEKKGIELYENEKYNEAIAEFDKAIEINKNDTDAYYYRGLSFFNQDMCDKAQPDFDKVISLDKESVMSYYFRGMCNTDQKKYNEAISDLSNYIENDKENKFAFFYRAASYVETEEYEKAVSDYFKVIELDSTYTEAFFMVGQLRYALTFEEEGCSFIVRAMEMGNKSAEDFYNKNCVTYWDLKLVKVWNQYNSAKIELELTNRFGKHIDIFWIKASLRDKAGEYLAGEERIHFDNIRPDGISVEGQSWSNINSNEIGKILLLPNRLEIEGEDIKFETNYVNILDNKYGIEVTF